MSGRIFRFDDSAHRAADSLLPWFVNETLDEDKRAAVDRHLRECARCRRETELLREVRVHCVTALPAADAAAGFHELSRRIAGGRLDADNVVTELGQKTRTIGANGAR